jgi:hypothetical protein
MMFLANGYFLRNSDKEPIKYKYVCSVMIPPQLVMTGAILKMETMSKAAAGSMNYMMYGNIGLQIFL